MGSVSGVAGIDPDTAETAARKLLETRVAAIRELAARRAELTTARDTLTAAERADTTAWAAAEKAGWTEPELRHVGFTPPTRRAPGRTRKAADT